MRTLPLLLAAIAAAPTAALAQRDGPPAYFFAGGTLGVAEPAGELADHVETGYGITGHVLFRPYPEGFFGLRLDGGYVNYGRESRDVMLSPTVGGRITVDLNTSNDILFFGVGPQLGLPSGRVRPYVNGSVGLAYFVTGSSLRGDDEDAFANTTNYDDSAFSWGGGAGTYVALRTGRLPIALDLGVRYQRTGSVSYLAEGGIVDRPDGSIALFPIQSDTELLTFQVGVTAAIGRSHDRDGDDDDDRGRSRRRR
jgi:hypothetical protein